MGLAARGADAARLLADLVTRDPAFVRGGTLAPGDIPVFTFHSLAPRSFERRMRFLKNAGYRTLGIREYLDALTGRRPAPERSVLITIDDGRATTWTVGFPILRALGLRAVAFVVTSVVCDSEDLGPTIADLPEPQWGPLVARDDLKDQPFITWGEARAMREVIDVESHTHWHARIPVGDALAGTMSDAMRSGYGVFDRPFLWTDGTLVRDASLPSGTPLPASAPRLAGRPAHRSLDGTFESPAEVEAAIRFDLAEARRLIRERTGADAKTVCYPWHVYSDLAKRIAAETGHEAAFAGKADAGPAISRPGCDLFALARVGEDYVERMPGPGRRSLLSVLGDKLRR